MEVDLQNNSIGDDGAHALAKVLRSNQSIVQMKLWGNPILEGGRDALSSAFKSSNIQAAYREACPDALKFAFELTGEEEDSDLSQRDLSDADAAAIGEALNDNSIYV